MYETRSATCVCPKACNIVHYKTSMSYASANQNHENRLDLSETFLKKAGKNLNESLDTKELILPDRRRANIEEMERVIRTLSQDVSWNVYNYTKYWRHAHNDVYDVIMKLGIHKMKEVLKRDFIKGWNNMYFYDCMTVSKCYTIMYVPDNYRKAKDTHFYLPLPGSYRKIELSPKECRKEKLIASKRALHNLDRVHDAYSNAVPLVNNRFIRKGRYDSLYLTGTLFPKTTEINQTYTRLRRHIKKYMENIEWLLQNHTIDDNWPEEIVEASVEYHKDIELYESLVIQQPLQRIMHQKNEINQMEEKVVNAKTRISGDIRYYLNNMHYLSDQWRNYSRSYATDTIGAYLENLTKQTHVSKLSLAVMFTSDKIMKQLDNYQDSAKSLQESLNKIDSALKDTRVEWCRQSYSIMSEPLLAAWFTKQFDHYNRSSVYEKAAMERYFMHNISSSIYFEMLRNDIDINLKCLFEDKKLKLPYNSELVSLRQVTAFQNKLESFLQKSRLDGTFFRYVSVIQTITHLLTTTNSNIHNYTSF